MHIRLLHAMKKILLARNSIRLNGEGKKATSHLKQKTGLLKKKKNKKMEERR